MRKASADELRLFLEELLDYCRNQDLAVFRGYLHTPDSLPSSEWEDAPDGWQSYIGLAKKLAATAVYVDASTFDEDDVNDALEDPPAEFVEAQQAVLAGRIQELARTIAADPRFAACRTEAQKLSVAQALLGPKEQRLARSGLLRRFTLRRSVRRRRSAFGTRRPT